jgi:transcriptional regulator with XRE-family HTH domain
MEPGMDSDRKTLKPNTLLRHQRESQNLTLQNVADKLYEMCSQEGRESGINADTVGRWERGISKPEAHYRAKLCLLFGKSAEELGLLEKQDDIETLTNAHESIAADTLKEQAIQIVISKDQPLVTIQVYQGSAIHTSGCTVRNDMMNEEAQFSPMSQDDWKDEMDKKRRELLKFLGIASSILLLPFPFVDWERIEDALEKPSHFDTVLIQEFEAINSQYWNLYLAAASKSLVLDGVLGQFKMLVQFLREPHTPHMHQQLCALSSNLSQLAGEIFFDRHEYESAKSCYVFAASIAKEAKAYDLWSCALVRHSFTAIYDDPVRYVDALPILQGAWHIARRGDSSLPTRYWVSAVEAEAQAGIGNLMACQDALERANGVLAIQQSSPAWTRFDSSRLPALRGTCFLRLELSNLAVPALEEGLGQFTKPGRKRGMVLTDLATAALQQRDVEKACAYLNQVLDIVALGSSGFLRGNVEHVRRELEPFAGSASVRTLDQRMR